MTKKTSYYIVDLTAFVEAVRDNGLLGVPLAEAIGVSETAVSRGRAEGMATRAAWRRAVVAWVDRLYAECEASGGPFIYEFKVGDELRCVPLPQRHAVTSPVAAPTTLTAPPAVEEPEDTAAPAPAPQPVESAPEPSTPTAPPATPQGTETEAVDNEVAGPVAAQPEALAASTASPAAPVEQETPEAQPAEAPATSAPEPEGELDEEEEEEGGGGLAQAVGKEHDPSSPWGDPSRFEESYVSQRLKEQFEAEFGDARGVATQFQPNWRVDGIPIQPSDEMIERYGLELGRKIWMYQHVCWTAGLVQTHLGLGYAEKTSRLLHRLELELALELMDKYRMTMDEEAEQAWTSDKRMEMVELQQKVIVYYDKLMIDLAPGRVLGFGIKVLIWVDSLIKWRKRRKIAEIWGLKP